MTASHHLNISIMLFSRNGQQKKYLEMDDQHLQV